MTEKNPIKVFSSDENAKRLYRYIQQGIKEKYNITIDERYKKDMLSIMEMVVAPVRKTPPNGISPDKLLRVLNEQTLKEALPLFATEVEKSRQQQPQPQQPFAAPPQRQSTVITRPMQSTPIDVQSDNTTYERLLEARTPMNQMQAAKQPIFADPEPEYIDDVNDLYEDAENKRQQRDFIPPPTELPFEPQKGFQLRERPTEYSAQPPRGSERYLEHQNIVAPPVVSIVTTKKGQQQPVEDETETGIASSTSLSFGDVVPQSATQMRVLIPKTSRNHVPDSRQIPHYFVINSRDRNTATYPSPSEYRIELRQNYIDVVSVELINAAIPLTFYNVNTSNNIVEYEEVDGTIIRATVPVGNYPDITTLLFATTSSMTAASSNGAVYSSSVNSLTGKVTLISNGANSSIFNLVFFGQPILDNTSSRDRPQYAPNSIAEMLGFGPLDYSGDLMYQATSLPNMTPEPNIYLHVRELELLESNNSNVHNAFAMINLGSEDNYGKFIYFAPEDPLRYIKVFSPPKGKLAYLTISFRNEQGDLIDFNGVNHSLTFSILCKDKSQGPYDEEEHSY